MIDWVILNKLNKTKFKKVLLIVKDESKVKKFIKSPCITLLEEKNFLEHYPENAYHIIVSWEILSEGTAYNIYTYLAKMNHLLRDDGIMMLRVLKNISHITEITIPPFCWNLERALSIGASKGLKIKGTFKEIKTKRASFYRFNYIPAI